MMSRESSSHLTRVRCRCGNVVETMATVDEITVEVCGVCHPALQARRAERDDDRRPTGYQMVGAVPADA